MDPSAKIPVIDRLKQTNNILVTVSANPTIDQLAACIGLTLFLNKMGKHATAIFSGTVPSTIEFLQPEKTFEKTTDSLRDFIISLDKSKADKLRYKVEQDVVKIFITPYRTTLSEKDLDFSQGDFNVDTVVALGVHKREELDHALAAHGRILHDATVISVNNNTAGNLGVINWTDAGASSLCEMMVDLGESLGPNLFDTQIATAYLSGIVAETHRFSNEKARPQTMALAGKLVAAGASPQLVAAKLEPPAPPAPKGKAPKKPTPPPSTKVAKGLEQEVNLRVEGKPTEKPEEEDPISKIDIDTQGTLHVQGEPAPPQQPPSSSSNELPSLSDVPPSRGGTFTANTKPEHEQFNGTTDPMSQPHEGVLLQHDKPAASPVSPQVDVEAKAKEARDAIEQARLSEPINPASLPPTQALGAQPVDLNPPSLSQNGPVPPNQNLPPPPPAPPPLMPPPSS